MPPIVLTALQILLLLLLYLFVARAVRAVVRDVVAPRAPAGVTAAPRSRSAERRSPDGPTELVVHPPKGRPQVVPLDGHDITFGRAPTSTVVLSDGFVSDSHARVYLSEGRWFVSDLGSTNGTYVNQRRVVEPAPLTAGDQIAIGKTNVQVRR